MTTCMLGVATTLIAQRPGFTMSYIESALSYWAHADSGRGQHLSSHIWEFQAARSYVRRTPIKLLEKLLRGCTANAIAVPRGGP